MLVLLLWQVDDVHGMSCIWNQLQQSIATRSSLWQRAAEFAVIADIAVVCQKDTKSCRKKSKAVQLQKVGEQSKSLNSRK
jgi:hypothetical protein